MSRNNNGDMMNIDSIERKLGELDGKITLILQKLEHMEKKYNGITEKVIRNEENIDEIRKVLQNHLMLHEKESERKFRMKDKIILIIITIILTYLASIIMYILGFGGVIR